MDTNTKLVFAWMWHFRVPEEVIRCLEQVLQSNLVAHTNLRSRVKFPAVDIISNYTEKDHFEIQCPVSEATSVYNAFIKLAEEYIAVESGKGLEGFEFRKVAKIRGSAIEFSDEDEDGEDGTVPNQIQDKNNELEDPDDFADILIAHETVKRIYVSDRSSKLMVSTFTPSILNEIGNLTNTSLEMSTGTAKVLIKGEDEKGVDVAFAKLFNIEAAAACRTSMRLNFDFYISEAQHNFRLQVMLLRKAEDMRNQTTLIRDSSAYRGRSDISVVVMLCINTTTQEFGIVRKLQKPIEEVVSACRLWLNYEFQSQGGENLNIIPGGWIDQGVPQTKKAAVQRWVENSSEAKSDPFTQGAPDPMGLSPNKQSRNGDNDQKEKPSEGEAIRRPYAKRRLVQGYENEQIQSRPSTSFSELVRAPKVIPTNEKEDIMKDQLIDLSPVVTPPTALVSSTHSELHGLVIAEAEPSTASPPPIRPPVIPQRREKSSNASEHEQELTQPSEEYTVRALEQRQALRQDKSKAVSWKSTVVTSNPILTGELLEGTTSRAQPLNTPHAFHGRSRPVYRGARSVARIPTSTARTSTSTRSAPGTERWQHWTKSQDQQAIRTHVREPQQGETVTDGAQEVSEVDTRRYNKTMSQKAAAPTTNDMKKDIGVLGKSETALASILLAARSIAGSIELKVNIGRILVEGQPIDSKFKTSSFAPTDWSSVFYTGKNSGSALTAFTEILTTSSIDVERILDLKQSSFPSSSAQRLFCAALHTRIISYEIFCRTKKGIELIISVDQDKKYKVLRPTSTVGTINWHFPKRLWDARLAVTETPLENRDYQDAIKSIVDNIYIPPNRTIFELCTKVPNHDLTIQSVALRRQTIHSSKTHPGLHLHLTEVQDLFLGNLNGSNLQYHAYAKDPRDMNLDSTRLWWEVSLSSEIATCELNTNSTLELGAEASWSPGFMAEWGVLEQMLDLTKEVVTNIDGVGLGNRRASGTSAWESKSRVTKISNKTPYLKPPAQGFW